MPQTKQTAEKGLEKVECHGRGANSDSIYCHVFEKRGEHFVYSPRINRFFRVDAPTYHYIKALQAGKTEAEARQLVLADCGDGGTDAPDLESIESEFALLWEQGIFDAPDFSLNEDEIDQELKRRYSSPWNKLQLALAESCNLDCSYCYCKTCRDMPNQGLMPQNIARQAITWLFAMSGRSKELHITFFGGEPLLNKPVLRFAIEYSQHLAQQHGKMVRYSMTTNGTLLDDEVIGYIKKHNFGLMVSLDGPPEVHNTQCPTHDGRDSFDMAAKGIKKLMNRRTNVTVRCTMTHNGPTRRTLIKFFEDFGFSRIVLGHAINPVRPSGVDLTLEDFERLDAEEDSLLEGMLLEIEQGTVPRHFPYGDFIRTDGGTSLAHRPDLCRCGACRGTTTVGADGKLYPCHRFTGMKNWVIGTIATGPDIERCELFWRRYHDRIKGECDTCWARLHCKAPCPWELAMEQMKFSKIDAQQCERIRHHFENGSWLQYSMQTNCPAMYEKLVKGD